jgi:hypothetical protein
MLALPKGPNRIGVSLSLRLKMETSNFRNVVFSSYLEFLTIYKVHKPSDSEHTNIVPKR